MQSLNIEHFQVFVDKGRRTVSGVAHEGGDDREDAKTAWRQRGSEGAVAEENKRDAEGDSVYARRTQ